MSRELSPFELDRELGRVAPRARAAYRALRAGGDVTLTVPEVLTHGETLERLQGMRSDPLAPALLRWLYWLRRMQQGLAREGERVRRYRAERHALDQPLSGQFTWRELLGHALRDAARRPALLDVLLERGAALRDAGNRQLELCAELGSFAGRSRAELELPCPQIASVATELLHTSRDAYGSLGVTTLAQTLELGLAHAADDGWPRQLSLRTLNDLLGHRDWLQGLRLDPGELPRPLSASSFVRGLLRLGAAWSEALAPSTQPFCVAFDPFGLARAQHGALLAGLTREPVFLQKQLGLGKERALRHARALSGSALAFARGLALRVLQDEPALAGPRALEEALAEHAPLALGFELPRGAAGLFFRPRWGDAQRLAGLVLAATRAEQLRTEHDEDWFRNPRAIEQLRAEARLPPATSASEEALNAGVRALTAQLSQQL